MANTDPFRLAILKRLTTMLEGIGAATGYTTEMTGRVFRGRVMFGDNDPLPMIAIIEPPVPVDQFQAPLESDTSTGNWDLLIQGFLPDDPKNPTDPGHFLAAQVRKVLSAHKAAKSPDQGFFATSYRVSRVKDIFIGAPIVRPSDEISAKAYFWLPVTLAVEENLADPLDYT